MAKAKLTLISLTMAVLSVAPLNSLAQNEAAKADDDRPIKKGTFIVGSYFNFSVLNSSKDRVRGFDTETSTIRLGGDVTLGKLFTDHWAYVVNLGYTSTSSSAPQVVGNGPSAVLYNLKSDQNDFKVTPSLRYYKQVGDGYYFFIQTAVQVTFGSLASDELDKNDIPVH